MRRPALITFLIMASVFMGGGIIGFVLTAALTETGSMARLFGLCSLPLAFIIGAQLWLGYASVRLGRICSSEAMRRALLNRAPFHRDQRPLCSPPRQYPRFWALWLRWRPAGWGFCQRWQCSSG